MNHHFHVTVLMVLASIPAISFAADSDSYTDAALKLASKPGRVVMHTSLADIFRFVSNMTLAQLPLVSSIYQNGKQNDYTQRKAPLIQPGVVDTWFYDSTQDQYFYKFNVVKYIPATALAALVPYSLATDKWQARTKLVNAFKYAKSKVCCSKK